MFDGELPAIKRQSCLLCAICRLLDDKVIVCSLIKRQYYDHQQCFVLWNNNLYYFTATKLADSKPCRNNHNISHIEWP